MKPCMFLLGLFTLALLPAIVRLETRAEPRAGEDINNANNLRQIGLAMHSYHDQFKSLPPAAVYDKDGKKALLSWRVLILPYLDQGNLAKQFKMDEPWDSDNNKKLLDKMPSVFGPISNKKEDAGKTHYRVFTGPGTVFEGTKGIRFMAITDGTSNTILAVEANEAVEWTKPGDLEFKDKEALPKLGGHTKGGFAVLMCDGSAKIFRPDFDEKQMRNAILRADGNLVDFTKLER
jgi:hypothetical protein